MAKTLTQPALAWPGILVLLAGQLLPLVDFSIINVALIAISRDLGASHTELELVVAVYGIAFAVSLALGGRLGDKLGRRRLFIWGAALFGLASLLCGLAVNVPMLLAARVLQGIGAALAVPQILATLHVSLKGETHSKAIGAYGSVGGVAFIIGQVLGGLLVSWNIAGLGWRSVFLINLPICLAILWAAPRWVPQTRSDHAPGLDLKGAGLLALILSCLLLAMSLGPVLGWPLWAKVLPLAAAGLAWVLWQVEKRQPFPLLPPRLFALVSMRFGLLLALLFFGSWGGFMFVLALTLQAGLGMSPALSGESFIALGLVFFLVAVNSARVNRRLGPVRTLVLGHCLQIPGLALLIATFQSQWPAISVWSLVPATALVGAGQALIVGCFYRISLADVPHSDAGAGSAMLSTMQQSALSLGPALFGGVFAWRLSGGSYPAALSLALELEIGAMMLLVLCACHYGFKVRRSARLAAG